MTKSKPLKIIVLGASGQLGKTFQMKLSDRSAFDCVFLNKKDLDITDFIAVEDYFGPSMFDYCINCAAYTAVDKAETEDGKARVINVDAV